jgi:LuxR family maltose regulon positive regulatory protein
LVAILAGDEALVDEINKIHSFVRFDVYINAYLIHQLFLDYLRQKQDALTEEEKRDTYLKAARWCVENDFTMDAVSYYDKAGDYESIIEIVYLFPLQIPVDRAKFILDIYDYGPVELLENIAPYHLQRARLLMSLGRYEEAIAWINERIRKYSALPGSDFNNRVLCGAYEALGITEYLMIPYTDHRDFDALLEKADEYYGLSPYPEFGPVTCISLDAWVSRVGVTRSGAMEEYIETLTRAIPHAASILNGCMFGLDDLARGELKFYKGDLKVAEKFLMQALYKAESRSQYEVRNRALFYLLRIHAANGNYDKIQEVFKSLEAQLEIHEYPSRFVTFEIVSGWYYATIDQPQNVADWLKGNFAEGSFGAFIANFGNMVKAKYYYAGRRFDALLSYVENLQGTGDILFKKLEMKVLEAVCRYQTKNRGGAIAALREAYDLALSNDLTMPFIEFGRDMRTLATAAMRDKDCGIPKSWLDSISRKSGSYAKRVAFAAAEYKKANNLDEDVRLSSKETDILNDLYEGLSRAQIAAKHNFHVNTARMVLNSIYMKLGADNLADAIRIATDRNLID